MTPKNKALDIQSHYANILIKNLGHQHEWKLAQSQALHEVEMIISIMESNLLTKVIFYKQIKFYKLAEKYIRTGN